MQYFTYNNRRYFLIFLIITIYLLYSHSAFASGGAPNYPGSTWQPGYGTSDEYTGSAPTFGVWVCTISSKLTYWMPSTPSDLWLSNISREIGDNIPFVGRGIFYRLISDIRNVLVLVAAFKVFKSLSRF